MGKVKKTKRSGRGKIKDPVKVLTSNNIHSNIDAVKLVREVREELC